MANLAAPSAGKLWCPRGIDVTVRGPASRRRQFQFDQPYARIGGHAQAEVALSEPGWLPCQLFLHVTSGGIYCLGLADGAPNGWMYPKVRAKLGPYLISARFDGHEAPPPNMAPDPVTTFVVAGPWPRFEIGSRKSIANTVQRPLPRRLTLVGRQEPSTLLLRHRSVSRAHCVLFWDGDVLWVVDLLSRNGTHLDGHRVRASAVEPGQILGVGEIELRYLGLTEHRQRPETELAQARQVLAEYQATADRERQVLAGEIERLNGTLTAVEARRAEELAQAQGEAAAARSAQADLQAAAVRQERELQEQLAGWERQFAEQSAGFSRQQAELVEATSAERSRLESELAQVRLELDRATAALIAARGDPGRQDTLAGEIERLKGTLTAVEARRCEELAEAHGQAAAARSAQADLQAAAVRQERELQEQLAGMERRFAEQSAGFSRQQAELVEATSAERSRLENELAQVRLELDRATAALVAAQGDRGRQDSLESDLAAARRQVMELDENLARARRRLARQWKRRHAQRRALEQDSARLDGERQQLEEELVRARQSLAEHQATADRERQALAGEIERLKGTLTAVEARRAEELAQAQGEAAAARSAQADLQAAAVRQERELQEELAGWERRFAEQSDSYSRQQAELAGERQQLEEELVRARQTLAEHQATADRERQALAGEIERLKGTLTAVEARRAEELAEAHGQAAAARSAQADLQAAAVRQERELQEQLAGWERRFAEQSDSYSRQQAELAGERQQLEEELLRARQTLAEYQAAADHERQLLAGEIERLHGMLKAVEAQRVEELAEAHGQVAAARSAQTDLEAAAVRELQEQLAGWERRFAEQSDSYSRQQTQLAGEQQQLQEELARALQCLAEYQTAADRERQRLAGEIERLKGMLTAVEARRAEELAEAQGEAAAARRAQADLEAAVVRQERDLQEQLAGWERRFAEQSAGFSRQQAELVDATCEERTRLESELTQLEEELVRARQTLAEYQAAADQERQVLVGEIDPRNGVPATNERLVAAEAQAGAEVQAQAIVPIASRGRETERDEPPREHLFVELRRAAQKSTDGMLDDRLIGRLLAFKAKRDADQRRQAFLWTACAAGLLVAGIVGIVGLKQGWFTAGFDSPSETAEQPANEAAAFE